VGVINYDESLPGGANTGGVDGGGRNRGGKPAYTVNRLRGQPSIVIIVNEPPSIDSFNNKQRHHNDAMCARHTYMRFNREDRKESSTTITKC
jgi:hypothetical protein